VLLVTAPPSGQLGCLIARNCLQCTDGRIYPWGNNEPTDKLCNFDDNIDGTTPVGQYLPQGDSPYSCVDMSGNVWEWCLNKYEKPEDKTLDQSIAGRVVRGGSWLNSQRRARAAYCNYDTPGFRLNFIGFRAMLRPPSQ
jgi:formylglycine-generating enzyme required for sulfatase activity